MSREGIDLADFLKVDIRIGTVVAAADHAGALKPAYTLQVDFGPEIGIKGSSARITEHHTADGLIGRQVAAVVNLPPRRVGEFLSDVLVLGFPDENGAVRLVGVEKPVPNGGRLF